MVHQNATIRGTLKIISFNTGTAYNQQANIIMPQQKPPLEYYDYLIKWINSLHNDSVEEILSKKNVY